MMNLLLVGASEAVTGVIGHALNKMGYRTKIATSVDAARRLLSGERVDVVVVDSDGQPEESATLVEWIRERTALRNLPIMFLATEVDAEMIKTMAQLGQVDFLMKPVKNRLLHERIERLVWVGSPPDTITPRVSGPRTTVPTTDTSAIDLEALTIKLEGVLHRGAIRLYRALANPMTCATAARNIASADQGLREAILAKVNDPEFGLETKVEQLGEACALLGARELGMATFKNSILEPDSTAAQAVRRAWTHMITTGFVAQRIGEVICPQQATELGLAGVLHGIGLVGLLEADLESYSNIVEQANNGESDWVELERVSLGFDHAELGASLARRLRVSNDVCTMIHECGKLETIQSIGSWCLSVASVTCQRFHSDFPRVRDPEGTLRALANSRPQAWEMIAAKIPDFFQSVSDQQEVFNS